MANLNYLKKECVIGDNKKEEKIGGIKIRKLIKVYLSLRANYVDVINFRLLSFQNFVDFVTGNDFDEEDVEINTLAYELRTNPIYGLE